QPYEALLLLQPEPLAVEIGQEAPARLVVGVGDVVPRPGAFPGDLTDSGHLASLRARVKSEALYTPRGTVGKAPPAPPRASDPAALGQRNVPAAAHHQVIQQAHFDQGQRLGQLE